jgi:wyosine [tRNA(Phe)-imidazoG37] synthetase (radical SAM superfamily)
MDQSKAGLFSEHRRDREAGRLVYPVLSRRSGGLSVGVNLFPDAKSCSFDCPYCEVFPPSAAAAPAPFEPGELEAELDDFLDRGYSEEWAPEPVRDLCLSGNGEPSLSPHLEAAIGTLARAKRRRPALLGRAELVIITNSTGFLVPRVAALLERAVAEEGLVVWAKLDGATSGSFRRMSRSAYALDDIVSGIASFAARSPVVLQTMLCEVGGVVPTREEADALAGLVGRLVSDGARITSMQLYTKARPSPESGTEPVSDALLADLARVVAAALPLKVRAYGASGEIGLR